MPEIHPTAVVHPTAEIADDVKIGPFCVVGEQVKLGSGCVLHSHVVIDGPSSFGSGNEFFSFSVIGLKSQDLKYQGEPTYLEVGDNNVFRENATINRATDIGGRTRIGNNNLFLVSCHAGHDCQIGNHVIFSGFATAAGHVTVGDHAILAGCCAVHQFVRIGEHAMVGAVARVAQDVLPYTIVEGHPAVTRAVNSIGMQRRGFSEEDLRAVRMCYKKLFVNKKLTVHEAIEELLQSPYGENPCLQRIIEFVQTSERGFCH
ncbi:MAG: acyl-ACP--UDP-N-acetylglucosamine O-acyltransferase [Akkermansiaceae bacterium]|nr:acyl-ACP--UDP-N-acetylglucosamine O-acyltransferase [Akkermansiaceae bacterium]